jgi:hypothetical protein
MPLEEEPEGLMADTEKPALHTLLSQFQNSSVLKLLCGHEMLRAKY